VTLGDIVTDGYDAQTTTNRLTVSLPVTGRNRFHTGGLSFDAAGSDALLIQPGTRKSAKRANGADRSRTLSAIVPAPSESAHIGKYLQVGRMSAARSLRSFLVHVFSEMRNADSPLRRPVASAAIEALVIDLVHALCDAPTPLSASDNSASARVNAACEYMQAHAHEALTVQQIANAVGIGPRHLQSAFRDITGMSPREKLTEIRLEYVHAKLTGPEEGTTVSNTALDCGFAHLGRFAAAYRQRYGESPTRTLLRAYRLH
jgi:AraC-like DNA-binding protein